MSLPCEEIVHVKARSNVVFYLTLDIKDNKTDLLDFAVERRRIIIEGSNEEIRAYKASTKGQSLLEEFNRSHSEQLKTFFELNDGEKEQLLKDLLSFVDEKTGRKYHKRIEKIKQKIAGYIKVQVVDSGVYCEGDEEVNDYINKYIPDDPYMYGDFPVPLDP